MVSAAGIDLRGNLTDVAGILDLHVVSENTVVVLHDVAADAEHGKPSTRLQAVQFQEGEHSAPVNILWSKRDELGGSIFSDARIAGDAHHYVAVVVVQAGDCHLMVLDPLTGDQRARWPFRVFGLGIDCFGCSIFPGPAGSAELRIVTEKPSGDIPDPENPADVIRHGYLVRVHLLTGEVLSYDSFVTPRPSIGVGSEGVGVEYVDRRGWLYVSLTTVAPGDHRDFSADLGVPCRTEEIDESLGGPLPRPGRLCVCYASSAEDLKQGVWRLLTTSADGTLIRMAVDDADPENVTVYTVDAPYLGQKKPKDDRDSEPDDEISESVSAPSLIQAEKKSRELVPDVCNWTAWNSTVVPLHNLHAFKWQADPFCPFSSLLLRTGPVGHRLYAVDELHSKMYVLV